MKHAVIALLVLAVGAAVAVLVVVGLPEGTGGTPASGPAGQGGAIAPGDWPIYRGNAGMMGVAAGALPDAMRVRWRFKTGRGVFSTPIIADGRVYFGSGDGNIYCVSAQTGEKVWSFAADDQVQAPPLLLAGKLYVGSDDQHFYCLDAAGGKLLWKFQADGRIVGSANAIIDPNGTHPPRVVFGSHDNNVYCLDAATGRLAWKTSADNYINGGMAVAGTYIVFGSCDSSLHALRTDGTKAGTIQASAFLAVTPAFDGRLAYAGDLGGEFVCFDVPGRKIVWRFKAPKQAGADSMFEASPAVDAARVLAGCSDGRLYCLDRTSGGLLWVYRARDEIDCSPVICGSRAVLGSIDGVLHVVDISTGQAVWTYDLGRAITTSPAVGAGIVVVGCDDGAVFAFEAKR